MLYEFYLYKEYYNKISLWWINQIVAANTHIVGMQYLIFTSFHVITRDKILKSGRKWRLNQNSDAISIVFDNESSNYFDNFLRNPMIPYSFHVISYESRFALRNFGKTAKLSKWFDKNLIRTVHFWMVREQFLLECSEHIKKGLVLGF